MSTRGSLSVGMHECDWRSSEPGIIILYLQPARATRAAEVPHDGRDLDQVEAMSAAFCVIIGPMRRGTPNAARGRSS